MTDQTLQRLNAALNALKQATDAYGCGTLTHSGFFAEVRDAQKLFTDALNEAKKRPEG